MNIGRKIDFGMLKAKKQQRLGHVSEVAVLRNQEADRGAEGDG
ncbi:hypothetical protein ACVWZW_002766 [Bradyrhizobium sp. F1.13.4]